LLSGDKRDLKQLVSNILIIFINIMNNEKNTIDISYKQVKDNIFKLKEREKDLITDKLKGLSDEAREVDTILKINKLGEWSKGLQKGLTVYDERMYEEEASFRDEMEKAERKIRQNNPNVSDENINQYIDDYMEERREGEDIDNEAYDLGHLNEDFYDGEYDGVEAPEEEYDDYEDYN
jgi:hypothetical protein